MVPERPRLRLTTAQRMLAWGTAIILLLGAVLFAFASWSDYRDTQRMLADRGEHIARMVGEHARGVIQTSRAVLRHASEFASATEWGRPPTHADWLEMVSLARNLPEHGTLWTVDQEGMLTMHTADFPAPPVSVREQRYFQEHESGAQIVIGEAIQGKVTGTQFMTVSQRLARPDGSFRGIIGAGIELRHFSAFYATLGSDPDMNLALYRPDGRLVVQFPTPRLADLGRDHADLPLFAKLTDAARGSYLARSAPDGAERLYHYAIVPGADLIAVAGLSVETALRPWRARMQRNALGAAVATTGLLALALVGYRALRRQERGQAALAEAHAQLQNTMSRLDRARIEADQANLAKSRFLAAASHDLRQPLQAVSLFIDVLLNILDKGPGAEVAGKAREALDSSSSLLDSLLNLSVLEAGTLRADLRPVGVEQILHPLAQEFAPQFERMGLVFRHVSCTAPIRTDPVLMQRILRNLLANALRYAGEGRVLLGCRRNGRHLSVEVWDTGPGIPAEKLPLIFQEFYQLDMPSRDTVKGLGLGLAIVAKTARMIGHKVGVRSRPGCGTAFAIVAPLAAEAEVSAPCGEIRQGGIEVMERQPAVRLAGSASPAPPSPESRLRSGWHWS